MELRETKSISGDVVRLGDLLADKILEDASKQSKKISKITGAMFVENDITQNLYGEIDSIETLKVHYILYFFKDMSEYNQWLKTVSLNDDVMHYNSYADYESKTMQIVSVYINGQIHTDFKENILHELTHLYQYGKGMEKRVNLYDKVISMCSCDDYMAIAVAKTVYYTFKHEQDAMAHQFYAYLCQENPSSEIDEILENSEYGRALDYLYVINNNKEEAKPFIKELGFTIEQWNKRIYYGYKRFRQKLYNAFLYYMQTMTYPKLKNESKTFEINLRGQIVFDCFLREARRKYGNVELAVESIYHF